MAMSSAMMFAPAEKFAPSFPITRPRNEASVRSSALFIISTIESSMEFILVWNSRRSAPSPMSHSVALSFPSRRLLPRRRCSTRKVRGFSRTGTAFFAEMSQAVSLVPSTP